MTANSLRVELGATYVQLFLAADSSFLAQAIGQQPVRIVSVADGATAPDDDTDNYFIIESARGGSDSIARPGFDGSDIYARSDSDTVKAYITKTPS